MKGESVSCRKLFPLLLSGVFCLTVFWAVTAGSADIPVSDIWKIIISPWFGTNNSVPSSTVIILKELRLPRIILAVLAGMGLSTSGAVFQGVFRNPMANPYILGISSGAAFGVTLGTVLAGSNTIFGAGVTVVSAFAGAAGTSLFVYLISGGGRDILSLLLSGIAAGFFLSALMSFLMYFNHAQLTSIIYWSMGSFSAAGWNKVIALAAAVIPGILLLLVFAPDLDLLVLGEDTAGSMGISVVKTRLLFLLISTLITAGAVSVSGIIGFVGLIVPHIMRILTGPSHRKLILYSMAGGAILLLFSDTLARSILSPAEIPVGIVTSLFGAPFFLFLLRKKGSSSYE